MEKLTILILFILGSTNFVTGQPISIENEHKNLRLLKEIKLSDELIIGDITKMDSYKNEKFVIVDAVGKQVYLIDSLGQLIKTLNPEECHPGFHWYPLSAFFNQEGNIYIINSAPWGFKFGSNGECFGPLDNSFLAAISFTFNSSNQIIGYYNTLPSPTLRLMTPEGKKIKDFGFFPKEFLNVIHRFECGGIITDKKDNVYQVNINSPDIFKYDKEYKLVATYKHKPSYYKNIETDISSSPGEVMRDVNRILKDKTLTQDIILLDKDKILVQFAQMSSERFYGIEIFDLNGNRLNKEEIKFRLPVLAAENGSVFFRQQKPPTAEGELPNPSILEYKLIFK